MSDSLHKEEKKLVVKKTSSETISNVSSIDDDDDWKNYGIAIAPTGKKVRLYKKQPVEQIVSNSKNTLSTDKDLVTKECSVSSSDKKTDTEPEFDEIERGTYCEVLQQFKGWRSVEVYSGHHKKQGWLDPESFLPQPALPTDFADTMKYIEVFSDKPFGEKVAMEDVMQGPLDDCFLLAPLAAFASTQSGCQRLMNMLRVNSNARTYTVRFGANRYGVGDAPKPRSNEGGRFKGQALSVDVDCWLPVTLDGKWNFCGYGRTADVKVQGLWAVVIEKAYATLYTHGYHELHEMGNPDHAFCRLGEMRIDSVTGMKKDSDDDVVGYLDEWKGLPICADTPTKNVPQNIKPAHTYIVLDWDKSFVIIWDQAGYKRDKREPQKLTIKEFRTAFSTVIGPHTPDHGTGEPNCYGHALRILSDLKPGTNNEGEELDWSSDDIVFDDKTHPAKLLAACMRDGLVDKPDNALWRIAVYVTKYEKGIDYHFFREDSKDSWSHKLGGTGKVVEKLDHEKEAKALANTQDPNGMLMVSLHFCGYLYVPRYFAWVDEDEEELQPKWP